MRLDFGVPVQLDVAVPVAPDPMHALLEHHSAARLQSMLPVRAADPTKLARMQISPRDAGQLLAKTMVGLNRPLQSLSTSKRLRLDQSPTYTAIRRGDPFNHRQGVNDYRLVKERFAPTALRSERPRPSRSSVDLNTRSRLAWAAAINIDK